MGFLLLLYSLDWDWLVCSKAFPDWFILKGMLLPTFCFHRWDVLLAPDSRANKNLTYSMKESDVGSILFHRSAWNFVLVSINVANDHSKGLYWGHCIHVHVLKFLLVPATLWCGQGVTACANSINYTGGNVYPWSLILLVSRNSITFSLSNDPHSKDVHMQRQGSVDFFLFFFFFFLFCHN